MQTFVPNTSITFVSKASIESGTIATYNLRKRVEPVKNCRSIGKKDMKYNDVMPKMKVDPETYVSYFELLRRNIVVANLCQTRSWKQTDRFAKQSRPQSYRLRRHTTCIEEY